MMERAAALRNSQKVKKRYRASVLMSFNTGVSRPTRKLKNLKGGKSKIVRSVCGSSFQKRTATHQVEDVDSETPFPLHDAGKTSDGKIQPICNAKGRRTSVTQMVRSRAHENSQVRTRLRRRPY
jgi:hypothetical protein